MMKGYLTISELSSMWNITSDTLRYYDKIDLFRPSYIDEKTGYRYYSYAQCEQIGTILELRNMGMSTSEIRRYMGQRSLNSSVELLGSLERRLAQQIESMGNIRRAIDERLRHLEEIVSRYQENIMEVEHIKSRRILCTDHYIEYLSDGIHAQAELESLFKKDASAYITGNIGTMIQKESFWDSGHRGLCRAPLKFLNEENEKMLTEKGKQHIICLEEGDYLCVMGKGRFRYNCETADRIRKYVREHSYEICGNLIEHDLVDISFTDDINEVIYQIEVPLLKSPKIF